MSKTISECLIVVDMEEDFLGYVDDDRAMDKLLNGILREIKVAKKKRLPIVCLQYANQEDGFDHPKESWEYHATIPEIRKALKGYSRAFYAWKDNDDGSEEVMDVLHGIEPRNCLDKPSFRGKANKLRKFITNEHKIVVFTVVGVNADACVKSTCGGLVDMGHRCRVPADAAMNVVDCTFADESSGLDEMDGVRLTNMVLATVA